MRAGKTRRRNSLAIASRNPAIDLVLILSNPGLICNHCFLSWKLCLSDCIAQFPIFLAQLWFPNLSPSSLLVELFNM
ncbi:hypothetical protein CMV_013754 [Castanea mollissima]|uniref:Uncharacterized protein n=1 Tax=Castanea mollissima TaxID=60419 RepID=A0A8J4RCV1_9ROSI|nr:hypothetical protein CMV_013754 [Castanea mollissima]